MCIRSPQVAQQQVPTKKTSFKLNYRHVASCRFGNALLAYSLFHSLFSRQVLPPSFEESVSSLFLFPFFSFSLSPSLPAYPTSAVPFLYSTTHASSSWTTKLWNNKRLQRVLEVFLTHLKLLYVLSYSHPYYS